MRGHVAKKGDRYYVVIYEGVDPATTKKRYRWHLAGSTRGDADRLLNELVRQVHDGDYVPPDKITFGEYLTQRWLPTKKSQLRASTYNSYSNNVNVHVIPALGPIPIRRLRPEDLDSFYAELLANGRKTGKPGGLAPKTVRYIHLILRKALADAARKGTVPRNVALLADPPKLSAAPRAEMRTWTAVELQSFLELSHEHRLYSAWFLAAHTGVRRGELLGLRWRDVDLTTSRLSVRQALVSVAYDAQFSDVKTGAGRRTIDLDEPVLVVLRAWRRKQAEERLLLGPDYKESDLVFTRADGAPLHPDYFRQAFERFVKKTALPKIRFHDLRHTHASLLLQAGVPVKVVSERLGHANAAFTITVYQHVLPGMQADAARAFSRLLEAGEPSPGTT
jgi:integrase